MVAIVLLLVVILGGPGAARAQGVIGVDPTGRSGQPPPLPQVTPRPAPPPTQVLPPLPPAPPEELELIPRERIFVREIRVIGATVFSPAEIAKVTTPYTNRELSAEDLEAVRVALTLLYVNAGYVNSGAVIPEQTAADGVITLQIIEGELTRIAVGGNRWFRAPSSDQASSSGRACSTCWWRNGSRSGSCSTSTTISRPPWGPSAGW
jgi:hypothetical protein